MPFSSGLVGRQGTSKADFIGYSWISATIEISKSRRYFFQNFFFIEEMSKTFDSLEEFRFREGVTPFSSSWIPLVTCVLYFTLTRAFKLFVFNRKPLRSSLLLFLYNISLSFFSLILFISLGAVIFEKIQLYTPHELVCGSTIHHDGRLQFIYWLNYLFKYVELFDTFLLVARKKPVTFLHEYHHAATLVLCWIEQREYSTVQWVPIFLNLGVHVIMYYYFAMTALKRELWWKRYLTSLQIFQFIIDVFVCSYAYGVFILNGFDFDKCYGTELGAIAGIVVLFSYLALFVRFYMNTYKKKQLKDKKDT
ncbi:Putative elongation of fatty acids protein 1 [Galdieria sulphuraria]|nr:Putative elongation of fatty acids protein 1 [Galdieria sulphuraria]